jgi:hypothetical protein
VTSPTVWADARPRVQSVADALGCAVAWPNEEAEEPDPASGTLPLFLAVEIEGDASAPFEVGVGAIWQETGELSVHVLVPTGTGIDAGIAARKAITDAFRDVTTGPLIWDRFRFPPGGIDQNSGNWFRLTVGISYSYTDR